jgi:hypothetical protein
MKDARQLTDGVIETGGKRIPCHRVVVAAFSPWIKQQLAENPGNAEIELSNLRPEVIDKLYTFGHLSFASGDELLEICVELGIPVEVTELVGKFYLWSKHSILRRLSKDRLISVLSRDDLDAPSEYAIFNAVVDWVKLTPSNEEFFMEIMLHVRLNQIGKRSGQGSPRFTV